MNKVRESLGWFALVFLASLMMLGLGTVAAFLGVVLIMEWMETGILGLSLVVVHPFFVRLLVALWLFASVSFAVGFWKKHYPKAGKLWFEEEMFK